MIALRVFLSYALLTSIVSVSLRFPSHFPQRGKREKIEKIVGDGADAKLLKMLAFLRKGVPKMKSNIIVSISDLLGRLFITSLALLR